MEGATVPLSQECWLLTQQTVASPEPTDSCASCAELRIELACIKDQLDNVRHRLAIAKSLLNSLLRKENNARNEKDKGEGKTEEGHSLECLRQPGNANTEEKKRKEEHSLEYPTEPRNANTEGEKREEEHSFECPTEPGSAKTEEKRLEGDSLDYQTEPGNENKEEEKRGRGILRKCGRCILSSRHSACLASSIAESLGAGHGGRAGAFPTAHWMVAWVAGDGESASFASSSFAGHASSSFTIAASSPSPTIEGASSISGSGRAGRLPSAPDSPASAGSVGAGVPFSRSKSTTTGSGAAKVPSSEPSMGAGWPPSSIPASAAVGDTSLAGISAGMLSLDSTMGAASAGVAFTGAASAGTSEARANSPWALRRALFAGLTSSPASCLFLRMATFSFSAGTFIAAQGVDS